MKLFGPVLFYDLIRVARRGRYVLLRCLYALLLLLLMFAVYETHVTEYALQARGGDQQMSQQFMAEFAEKFFGWFIAAQFVAIVLLTPAYTAGAIAEEKQRQTIEYLFATDLANHEIILGKLASRVGNLALFIITGLPILSLVQLFGGITPMLLWCGFAATAVTMLSLASLSILQSVLARRVRDAMMRTYLIVIGYFAGWGVLAMIRMLLHVEPPAPEWVRSLFDRVMALYNTGNAASAFRELIAHLERAKSLGTRPLVLLLWYTLFHGTVTAICMGLAVAKLRSAYIRQVYGRVVKAMKQATATRPPRRLPPKPPLGAHPMIWKELHAERGLRLGVLGELAFIIIARGALSPAIVGSGIVVLEWVHKSEVAEIYQRNMNLYTRVAGTVLCAVIVVGAGIRAAGSIGAERDRLTYESLMSCPLTNHEILFGKWLAAVTGMRWVVGLLVAIWSLAVVCGALHVMAVPLLLGVLVFSVMFAASLGLWFGSFSKTGLRASMGTVVALLVVLLLPYLLSAAVQSLELGWIRALSPSTMIYSFSFWHVELGYLLQPGYPGPDTPSGPDDFRVSATTISTFYASLITAFGLAVAALAMALLAWRKFRLCCGRIVGQPRSEPIDARRRIHRE